MEKEELSKYHRAEESNDEIRKRDYRLKLNSREKNRIEDAKNRMRAYLQMCAISKPIPSSSSDIGGTRMLD